MGVEALLKGWVSRQQPQAKTDNDPTDVRLARYGEVYTASLMRKQHALADEGSYFVVNNAQTGIINGATTAFGATTPTLIIANTDSSIGGKRLYIDYITLDVSNIGSITTPRFVFAVVIDSGHRFSSIGTGTTLTSKIVNVNMDTAQATSIANVYFGGTLAATTATLSNRTVVGQRDLRSAALVQGDVYHINFGGVEGGSVLELATTVARQIAVPPVIIGPGQSFLFYIWHPGATVTTAESYLPEVGWWER